MNDNSQMRNCLPGVTATFMHGATTPDEVMKFIIEGEGASQILRETPAILSGQAQNIVLQNNLFSIQVCEKMEVMDGVLQLDYWLSIIELAFHVNKLVLLLNVAIIKAPDKNQIC